MRLGLDVVLAAVLLVRTTPMELKYVASLARDFFAARGIRTVCLCAGQKEGTVQGGPKVTK